ncbi:uroporphyrinogen decarboxylase [Acetobacterium wieringae]|uniref:Uroporphyrinogen decarboxylase n=1 Tax=Acetobacterium wieringae TaxID=52694 RepID=A0ABY6HIZ4_9FIRM|nr:uroporphyrinogen decarboxylase family protein [Acetobacterium wieringae]UYO64352.1 uroporphyrinogen decarboxylase [Acetobacterium wieringae]VUZ27129.1 Uncharacterised protein [Acetobacterium wieringae]
MLTKKQNLIETISGGKPDRFVNQYEFLTAIMETAVTMSGFPGPGGVGHDAWGVTWSWPEGQIGAFPVHDDEHKVLKDITEWKKYVKKPVVPTDDEIWAPAIEAVSKVDRNDQYVTVMAAPGLFETTHHLMGMEDALMAYYEEPEAMHELIDYITEYELDLAKVYIDKLKPDALFHHDDWGSQISTFISPEMFEEFFVPGYKKIISFYKDNGVELVVHHSDSFAATLVPSMIEMGIDIWQGVMKTNNIPDLIDQYGDKIAFMGGLHSGEIDFPDWTAENTAKHVEEACKNYGKRSFIPCLTSGLPMSNFPGVYDEVTAQIDKMSKELF